jgi:hypothetical protein
MGGCAVDDVARRFVDRVVTAIWAWPAEARATTKIPPTSTVKAIRIVIDRELWS